MKKMLFFAAFAAIISCAKIGPESTEGTENTGNADIPEQTETKEVTIYASMPTPEPTSLSKTQIDGTGNVTWSAGDVVKVCFPPHQSFWDGKYHYGASYEFTSQSDESSETALFKGEWTSSSEFASYGFIMYPKSVAFSSYYDAYKYNLNYTLEYNIPSEQEAVDNSFAKDLNLATAPVSKADMDANTVKATFKNLCSLIKVVLPQGDYNLKSITIESTNSDGSGVLYGTAMLSYGSSTGVVSIPKTGTLGYPSNTPSVTLQKKDGSNLTPGAAYYAVVWPSSHQGLKLTFTDVNGSEVEKQTPSGIIALSAGKYLTLNISSLEFDVKPTLSIGTDNVHLNRNGSSSNVTVVSNRNWTVESSADWLTATKSSGEVILAASANKEKSTRTATVTLTAESVLRTITVTQDPITYSIAGSALTKATDLADGQMYVIALNADRSRYWDIDENQKLTMTKTTSTSTFTCSQVFVFERDDSKVVDVNYGNGKYSHRCAGAWKSIWNDKYLDHDFALASNIYYFTMQNAWGTATSEDFDIYKSAENNVMMNCNEEYNGFYWGNGGTTYYKWSFYAVSAN